MEPNNFYKTNNCSDKSKLFILCMNTPNQNISLNPLSQNKCKYLFDEWYKCIVLDDLKINIK
jgi:hypothetical protein